MLNGHGTTVVLPSGASIINLTGSFVVSHSFAGFSSGAYADLLSSWSQTYRQDLPPESPRPEFTLRPPRKPRGGRPRKARYKPDSLLAILDRGLVASVWRSGTSYRSGILEIRYDPRRNRGQAITELVSTICHAKNTMSSCLKETMSDLRDHPDVAFVPGCYPGGYLPRIGDSPDVDWRPEETIPEDYYAL